MRGLRGTPGSEGKGSGRGRAWRGLLATTATVVALGALVASAAQAEVAYEQSGSFSDPSFKLLKDVAVDQTSDDVYVASFQNGSVEGESVGMTFRFDSAGVPLTPPTMGSAYYSGVAVNPLNHDVYGLARTPEGPEEELVSKIFAFSSTGTPGTSFAAPAKLYGQIATDSAGNIYVPNLFTGAVSKIDSAGNPIESFGEAGVIDCSDCPEPASFSLPFGVGVDSAGNVYVADRGNERVLKFDSTGAFKSVLYSGPAVSVEADSSSGNVFVLVAEEGSAFVLGFDASGAQFADFGQGTLSSAATGIAFDTSTGTVYVTDGMGAEEGVWIFTPVPAPTATTGAASSITQTTASLAATVNPKGSLTEDCHLEWGPSAGTYTTGQAPCTPFPGEGSADKAVKASATGLSANTTYHFRVVITTEGGTAEGNDAVFSTLADTCATNAALCPPVPGPPLVPPAPTPPVVTPPVVTPPANKPLKCKKGFKKKTVKGKAKCVKVKKKGKKH